MNNKEWIYREIYLLRQNYETATIDELKKLIPNRTKSAIKQQARKLGLKKADGFMSRYQFKKGNRPIFVNDKTNRNSYKKGNRPHNTRKIGDESIRTDGGRKYVVVKLADNKWIKKHILLWEKAHGKIPKGMFLVCKTNDTTNPSLDNWKLVSRAENMLRNSTNRIQAKKRIEKVRDIKRAYGLKF